MENYFVISLIMQEKTRKLKLKKYAIFLLDKKLF